MNFGMFFGQSKQHLGLYINTNFKAIGDFRIHEKNNSNFAFEGGEASRRSWGCKSEVHSTCFLAEFPVDFSHSYLQHNLA